MGKKGYHDGHRERLRKRFLDYGADALCEHELLELLLFYGIPRKNTNEIAHDLINMFGDLNGILNTSPAELQKVDGVGSSAALFIRFLSDVCGEYDNYSPSPDTPILTENFGEYFLDYFRGAADGLCLVLCPGMKCNITFSKDKLLNKTSDMVYITNKLIKREYNKIFIGINKTSGISFPETSDFALLKIMKQNFSSLGIMLEDFMIVGKRKAFSILYDSAFNI